MKQDLTDHQIYELRSKFNIEVREEASYLLWYIWKAKYAYYSSLPACIEALSEDDELYAALKAAHSRGKYDSIRNWKRAFRPLRSM